MTTLERPVIDISKTKVAGFQRRGFRRGGKVITNAGRVAEKVLEQVAKGKKKNIGKAMLEVGYSPSVAKIPAKVTEQEEYKRAIAEWPKKIALLREKTLEALMQKKLPKERTYDLTGLLKVSDHSTALAQGLATENVATKNEIVVFGSEDFLARQVNGQVKP